jgi:hypothetical protein
MEATPIFDSLPLKPELFVDGTAVLSVPFSAPEGVKGFCTIPRLLLVDTKQLHDGPAEDDAAELTALLSMPSTDLSDRLTQRIAVLATRTALLALPTVGEDVSPLALPAGILAATRKTQVSVA